MPKLNKHDAFAGLVQQIQRYVEELGGGRVVLRVKSLSQLQGELARLARTNEGVRNLFMAENTFKAFVRVQESNGLASAAELRGLASTVRADKGAADAYEVEQISRHMQKMGVKEAKHWGNWREVLEGVRDYLGKGVSQKEVKAFAESMRKGGSGAIWQEVARMADAHHAKVEKALREVASTADRAEKRLRGTLGAGDHDGPLTSKEAGRHLQKMQSERDALTAECRKAAQALQRALKTQKGALKKLGFDPQEGKVFGTGEVRRQLLNLGLDVANAKSKVLEMQGKLHAAERAVQHHASVVDRLEKHEEEMRQAKLTREEAKQFATPRLSIKLSMSGLRDNLDELLWQSSRALSDKRRSDAEEGTYVLKSGKHKGKTISEVYDLSQQQGGKAFGHLANMTEGKMLHSPMDKRAILKFLESNKDVSDWVNWYFKDRDGKSGPDLDLGGKYSTIDASRRGGGLRDPDRTDTVAQSTDEMSGLRKLRVEEKRRKRDPDYGGWDSKERAQIRRELLSGAWQRAGKAFEELRSKEWKKTKRKRGETWEDVWVKKDPVTGKLKYRKRDPEAWMKRLLMETYEEAELKQLARQMSEGGREVKAEEVVEVMVKLNKLKDAVDKKRFEDRKAMGEMSGGIDPDVVAGAPAGRHGRRLSTTDKLAMARLKDSGVENMAGAEDLKLVAPDESEKSWLERINGAQTLPEMEKVREEMHGEYHEYNLKTTPGVSEHWERLNTRIEEARAAASK